MRHRENHGTNDHTAAREQVSHHVQIGAACCYVFGTMEVQRADRICNEADNRNGKHRLRMHMNIIASETSYRLDDDVDTNADEEKSVREGSEDLDATQPKRIANVVLRARPRCKSQPEECNKERREVDEYMAGVRQKRETPRIESANNLRNEYG